MTKRWGPITWFFLHTFSEKIHENAFEKNKSIYLNLLYNLCINLPCPTCSNHAKYYLNSNKFKNIKNKNELRIFFWNFHNNVNMRLNKKIQDRSILKMYFHGNFQQILSMFQNILLRGGFSLNFINSMEKVKNVNILISTIYRNKIHFYK